MKKILSDPIWQGIGVIVTVIITILTFNYSSCSEKTSSEKSKEGIFQSDTIHLNKIRDSIAKVKKANVEIEKQKLFLEMADRVLSNLDKTEYNEKNFNYQSSGGIRSIYSRARSLVQYETFVNILPTSLYVSGPHTSKVLFLNTLNDFGHYNPEAIKWINEEITMYLNNNNNVSRTRPLVDEYLKKQLLIYWLCYNAMKNNPSENTYLLTDYKEKINAGNLPQGYYHLFTQKRAKEFNFYNELLRSNTVRNADMNTICSAIYFWLRRQIDSTDDEFYDTLNTIMKTYYPSETYGLQNLDALYSP